MEQRLISSGDYVIITPPPEGGPVYVVGGVTQDRGKAELFTVEEPKVRSIGWWDVANLRMAPVKHVELGNGLRPFI